MADQIPTPTQNSVHVSHDQATPTDKRQNVRQTAHERQKSREQVRKRYQQDPELCIALLDKYKRNGKTQQSGRCELLTLQPSKDKGYVQLSANANKFAAAQDVLVWSNAQVVKEGEQASHLCHNPACIVRTHIVPEPSENNQIRKNCLVWHDCHHCKKKYFVCKHEPACIKFCEGFGDPAHFLSEGICNDDARYRQVAPVPAVKNGKTTMLTIKIDIPGTLPYIPAHLLGVKRLA